MIAVVNTMLSLNPILYKDRYDPQQLRPFLGLTTSTTLIVTSESSKFHTLSDLMNAARARPGEVSVGTYGTPYHYTVDRLEKASGLVQ